VFDLAAIRSIIEGVRPGMQIFEVSSKMGAGLEIVVDFLRNQLAKFPSGQHRRRKNASSLFPSHKPRQSDKFRPPWIDDQFGPDYTQR
jgi:hypothetical protein